MLEGLEDFKFAGKAGNDPLVAGGLGREDFDGHRAATFSVRGAEHRAHAAFAQSFFQDKRPETPFLNTHRMLPARFRC